MSVPKKPIIKIKPDLLKSVEEKGTVVIHLIVPGQLKQIQLWSGAYLFASGCGHKSKLLHAEKIKMYPEWMIIPSTGHKFTLYFEALPNRCKTFDVREVIPQLTGWVFENVSRNATDVYRLRQLWAPTKP